MENLILMVHGLWLSFSDNIVLILMLNTFNSAFVIAYFEHHWQKLHDPKRHSPTYVLLRGVIHKPTFEMFRLLFATLPIISFFLLFRSIVQRFDTVKFMKDYGVKRI